MVTVPVANIKKFVEITFLLPNIWLNFEQKNNLIKYND